MASLRSIRLLTSTPASVLKKMITDRVLMVKPAAFNSNLETTSDNAFQQTSSSNIGPQEIQERALAEFQGLVAAISKAGVQVNVVEDTTSKPDAIFPNNWISFHSASSAGGNPIISLYPMKAPSRRLERREDIISTWSKRLGAEVRDYSCHEDRGMFLEGTGSMVLDREKNIVYACLSQRTNTDLLRDYCKDFDYSLVSFKANSLLPDGALLPIYHTNVIMSVGTTFAVVCLESITDQEEREKLKDSLEKSGKEVIPISLEQVAAFAGNILQLRTCEGTSVVVMSTQAFKVFTKDQMEAFSKHSCAVVHSDIKTIEQYGGGGTRCMITEVFPPLKSHE